MPECANTVVYRILRLLIVMCTYLADMRLSLLWRSRPHFLGEKRVVERKRVENPGSVSGDACVVGVPRGAVRDVADAAAGRRGDDGRPGTLSARLHQRTDAGEPDGSGTDHSHSTQLCTVTLLLLNDVDVHQSVRPSLRPSVHPSVRPSVPLSLRPSVTVVACIDTQVCCMYISLHVYLDVYNTYNIINYLLCYIAYILM